MPLGAKQKIGLTPFFASVDLNRLTAQGVGRLPARVTSVMSPEVPSPPSSPCSDPRKSKKVTVPVSDPHTT